MPSCCILPRGDGAYLHNPRLYGTCPTRNPIIRFAILLLVITSVSILSTPTNPNGQKVYIKTGPVE